MCAMRPDSARAQPALTLKQAVAASELRSPDLRTAQFRTSAAGLARQEAGLTPYPALRYKLGASYAPTGRYFGYDPALTNDGQLNAQLSVEGIIYNGGQYGMRTRQAELDIARAQTGLELTREDLRFNVTQAFLEDLRAHEAIAIESESVRELRDYRDLVDRLFHGGVAGYTDLLKTEVQLGTEEIALDKAHSDEIAARYALAVLLGTPSDTAFQLQGAYDSIFNQPAYQMASYDSLVTLSLALSQNEIERARIEVDLAKAQTKPTVDAIVDAGLLTSFQNLALPTADRSSMLGASAGISVTGPILDWGLNKVQVQQRELAVQILQSELETQRRELVAQLSQLQLLLRSARERLGRTRDNLKIAQDAYDLVRAKYTVGAALASEVLDAHRQIVDTKKGELDILTTIENYRSNLIHLTATPNANANTNGQ
jgi:outer membrane protein TolC